MSNAHISKRAKVTSDKPSYKEKIKTDSGYVWHYDEKALSERAKEKKEKLKKLDSGLKKVREKYQKDLGSDDLRTRAIATIVGIIDATSMRVGNKESAEENKTYGATTLKKKHVKISGDKAIFNFIGKSNVKQHQEVKDSKIIKVLKELIKNKSADDFIFEIDGKRIWDRAVNRYLQPFKISAKDIRGFHANRLMKEKLKGKGFEEALKEVAKIVGHEPSTLKNQYLDPELVTKYNTKKKASLSKRSTLEKYRKYIENLETKYIGKSEKEEGAHRVSRELSKRLSIKPGVRLNQLILSAWLNIMPFLPEGTIMTSGVRTKEDQLRIIDHFWKKIPNSAKPDNPTLEEKLKIINGPPYNYVVGPPEYKSQYGHLKGNAFDISGPGIDVNSIASIIKNISKSNVPVQLRALPEPQNNAVHITVLSATFDPTLVAKLFSLNSKLAYSDNDFIKNAYRDLLNSGAPITIISEFEDTFCFHREAGKYQDEINDPKWDEVLIDDEKKLTRRQIRDHYMKNKSKIMSEIKDKPVMLFIETDKNKNILKRNHDGKQIVITNDDPSKADSPNNYQYWVDRRLSGIHRVFEKNTNIGFVDLDLHGGFSKDRALQYAKKVSLEIKREFEVSSTIYDSGGSGFHIEFKLKEKMDIDKLRKKLKEICEELNKDFDGATTGIVKGKGMRTDITTLKQNGNIRVPYSLNETTGRAKIPAKTISKRAGEKYISTDEGREIAERSPDVFIRDYADRFPEFREMAIKSLAVKNPVSYFVVYKFQDQNMDSEINKLALYNLLATRPDIYFSAALYENDEFKEFHRLASYYAANVTPKFFLDVLLKVMPEHEEFREIAERKIQKTAGILEYPPKLYEEILPWLENTILEMTDEWLADFKAPEKQCESFDIDLSGMKIYNKYVDKFDIIQAGGMYKTLSVCIVPRINKNGIDALYKDDVIQPQIVLFGFPEYLHSLPSTEYNEHYMDEARTALKHELVHLSQIMLEVALGKEAGLPHYPNKDRKDYIVENKPVDQKQYQQSDIEFYPLIQNLYHELKKSLKSKFALNDKELEFIKHNFPNIVDDFGAINFEALNPTQKQSIFKIRFNSFIENNQYLNSLKDSPVRYNKALRELYRLFEPYTKIAKGALYGWWMSPDGDLYPVPPYGHADFVIGHPEFFGNVPDGKEYDTAFNNGWVRIVNGMDRVSIDIPKFSDKYLNSLQKNIGNIPIKKYVEIWIPGMESTIVVNYSDLAASNSFNELKKYKIASISKLAGVLDFPHKTYKEIANWFVPIFTNSIKNGSTEEVIGSGDEAFSINPGASKEFSISWDDVKQYIQNENIKTAIDDSKKYHNVVVKYVDGNSNEFKLMSFWEPMGIFMSYDIDSLHEEYKKIPEENRDFFIKYFVNLAKSTIRHELTHYVQYAIVGATSMKFGLPGNFNKDTNQMYGGAKIPKEYSDIGESAQHSLSDIEFYPIMNSLIGKMKDKVLDNKMYKYEYLQIKETFPDLKFNPMDGIEPLPKEIKRDLLEYRVKDFIAKNDRLNNLKHNKDKYQKAIRELYKVFSGEVEKVASISKRAQNEIRLNTKEKQIFDLLNKVVDYYNLNVDLFCVGGWPRDKLMGKESHDIDILVGGNISGIDFAEYVSKYIRDILKEPSKVGVIKENPEQSKHLAIGTINVLGESLDFVSPRSEVYSDDSRIPEIKPATVEEDLKDRRDFTINSLAYNISTGEIKDATGKGIDDLKNGVIRTPVDPYRTFEDDSLRILRAIRFASRLGFELDEELISAAKDPKIQQALRNKVSRERIEIELRKMITGPQPVRAMSLIKELGLRGEVFKLPESYEDFDMPQNSPHHQYNVWDHTMEVLSNIQEIIKDRNISEADKFVLNLAALMHDFGKLDPSVKGVKEVEGKIMNTYHGHEAQSMRIAEHVLRNLPGVKVEEIERVKKLIDAARRVNPQRCPADKACDLARKTLGKFIRDIGKDWELGIDLGMADTAGHFERQLETHPRTYYNSMKDQIRNMGPEQTQSMAPILNGKELMDMFGKKPGSWIGILHKELIDWQLENPQATKHDAIEFAKNIYKNKGLDKMAGISKRAYEDFRTDEEIISEIKDNIKKNIYTDGWTVLQFFKRRLFNKCRKCIEYMYDDVFNSIDNGDINYLREFGDVLSQNYRNIVNDVDILWDSFYRRIKQLKPDPYPYINKDFKNNPKSSPFDGAMVSYLADRKPDKYFSHFHFHRHPELWEDTLDAIKMFPASVFKYYNEFPENVKSKLSDVKNKINNMYTEYDKRNPDTAGRPQVAKEFAQQYFDSRNTGFVHVGSYQDLKNIDKIVGEISVSTLVNTNKLFSKQTPTSLAAIFSGKASHIFDRDKWSKERGGKALSGGGLRYTDKAYNPTDQKSTPEDHDEAFFNPSADGNKLVAYTLVGYPGTDKYKDLFYQGKKLEKETGIPFIPLIGSSWKWQKTIKDYNVYEPTHKREIPMSPYLEKSLVARKLSKRAMSDSAGVFIVLPEKLAKQFPPLGDHDSSPSHITSLYIGKVKKKQFDLIENTIKGVIYDQEPFDVLLDNKPTYFPATKHSDGCKIAKMKVLSPELHKLHKNLKESLKSAGVEIDDHFPAYKPHITLGYEDKNNIWEGDVPNGSFTVKEVVIWGLGKEIIVPFKKSLSKRAKQLIPGGKGKNLKPSDVDPKQLEMGIRVEMEHTNDKKLAEEIALDHLSEFGDYYTRLEKMEAGK